MSHYSEWKSWTKIANQLEKDMQDLHTRESKWVHDLDKSEQKITVTLPEKNREKHEYLSKLRAQCLEKAEYHGTKAKAGA